MPGKADTPSAIEARQNASVKLHEHHEVILIYSLYGYHDDMQAQFTA